MSVNTRQKLEQSRASFAFTRAKSAGENKEYKQWAKKVPMMIKTNGLGATLAFLYSKGETQRQIIRDLEEWFKMDEKCKGLIVLNNTSFHLVGEITQVDMAAYRALTIEAIAFLNWLRRFADGLIKD